MQLVVAAPELDMRYRTYRHYLMALHQSVEQNYGSGVQMHSAIVQSLRDNERFRRLRCSGIEYDESVGKLMRSAWASELAASESLAQPEPSASLSVPWAFVKLYYALHDAFEAFFLARGSHKTLAGKHSTFLYRIASFVVTDAMLPEPWSCWISGSGSGQQHGNFVYDPHRRVSNIQMPDGSDYNERIAQLLRTTHAERLKKQKARGTTSGKSAQRASTMMDFVYRLRTRTNYRDIDPYLFNLSGRSVAGDFSEPLLVLFDASMLMVETLVLAVIGQGAYERLAKQFIGWVGRDALSNFCARRDALLA